MHRFIVIDNHGRTRGGVEVRLQTQVTRLHRVAADRGWTLLPA
jgi:hypothetical protein